MAKETAEKKLLKLIESTQSQETATATPDAAAATAVPAANEAQKVLDSVRGSGISKLKLSLPPFFGQMLGFFKGGGLTLAGPGSFGLKDINKVLPVGIVVVAGFLFLSFFSGWNKVNKGINFPAEAPPANKDEFAPHFRELQEYIGAIARRNIFQPFEVKAAETETAGAETAMTPMDEHTKDLKLVGISWLDTPESASAMFENTQSGVTYFLKSGEQINNVTVKQIYADSVVITFGGEEMEMRL